MSVSDYFDKRSAEWEQLYQQDPRFVRRLEIIARELEALMRENTLSTALDAGCGTGLYSRWLVDKGLTVTAFDLAPQMVTLARSLSEDPANPRYYLSSLYDFSAPAPFDLVVALSMLEYVDETSQALATLTSFVSPGGFLVLSVPNKTGLTRKLENAARKLQGLTGNLLFKDRGEYLAHQRNQFSARDLDRTMRDLGFKLVKWRYMNAVLRIPGPLLKAFERKWWAALYLGVYQKSH